MALDNAGKEGDRGSTVPGPETSGNLSQPSAVEQLTSKIEADKQYGGADVKKMVDDALSADGREQKDRAEKAETEVKRLTGDLATVNTNMTNLTTQINEFTRAKNDAEADAVKDNPEALASLRVRQQNTAERIRLEGVEAQQKTRIAEQDTRDKTLDTRETGINIKLAAMAAGVDEKALVALVPDGDLGRLALAANTIKQSGSQVEIDPKTGQPVIDPKTGQPKPAGLTQLPVTTVSASGDSRSVSQKMLEDAKKK